MFSSFALFATNVGHEMKILAALEVKLREHKVHVANAFILPTLVFF